MRLPGFVAWCDRSPHAPDEEISRRASCNAHIVSSRQCELAVRPFRTTPESDTSSQPLVTAECIVAFAGRIDNRRELSWRLGRPELSDAGDGHLFAASYARWGDDFARFLTGEFSFCLYDRRSGTVCAGRDALGVRKLFVFEDGGRLWVASSLELLLDSARPPRRLDDEGLAAYLAGGTLFALSGRTLHRGVMHVPAGSVLRYRCGEPSATCRQFWEPDTETELRTSGTDECDAQFRSLLFDAVNDALRANGTVCTELSGGLDSSSVACVAHRLTSATACSRRSLVAYSLVDNAAADHDEARCQAAVYARYPMDHRTIDIDRLPDTLAVGEKAQPSFADLQTWFFAAQRMVADAFDPDAVLTGQGGDALLGLGLPPLERRRLSVQRLFHVGPASAGWLTPAMRRSVRDADFGSGRRAAYTTARSAHYHLIRNLAANLEDPAHHPIEPRFPLLQRSLVEFVVSLPWSHKRTRAASRVIQRRALASILPAEVRSRETKGDFTPRFLRTIRREWAAWDQLSHGDQLAAHSVVEPRPFRDACLRLRHGLVDETTRVLCAALLLECWLAATAPARKAA